MLYLDLFCAFVSKMCPKVISSLLYSILAYESSPRNALLSDSGGNLYLLGFQNMSGSSGRVVPKKCDVEPEIKLTVKTTYCRTSLAVQWLRLHTFTAGGADSTPGRGTKILHA